MDFTDILYGELSQDFVIQRSSGSFVAGGWTDSKTSIPATGAVSAATNKELAQIPEGDRVSGSMIFRCDQELFITHEDVINGQQPGTSDVILWENQQWRLYSVKPYGGIANVWIAIGCRMQGS